MSLCRKRLRGDWLAAFGHPLLLLETFVDPQRFRGTVYQAANWVYVGTTRGFRRIREGYSNTCDAPKKVFVYPLQPDAQALLSQPILASPYRIGETQEMLLTAAQMKSLPEFFADIADPRRAQGRRHRLLAAQSR